MTMRRHLSFRLASVVLGLALGLFATVARADDERARGVADDPDGFVNLRAAKDASSRVLARVRTGEPFRFSCERGDEWARVTLASGVSGWMYHDRIRHFFTVKDLPTKTPGEAPSEIEDLASRENLDYYATMRAAVRGDAKARRDFFNLTQTVDGAAAEGFAPDLRTVFHLIGDAPLADFLRGEPLGFQLMVRNALSTGMATWPFESAEYLTRHFPKTAAIFFRKEMVGWPSPDGRFAIRKVFTEPNDLNVSKVEKAELIEQASGRVVCDLTRDDIGFGPDREGEAVWSPDSKRVACVFSDLSTWPGNLFSTPPTHPKYKRTMVYELAGDAFKKAGVNLNRPPGRAEDPEFKDAKCGHEFLEPVRWSSAHELTLDRHDYYERLQDRGLIHGFARRYVVTVAFKDEAAPDVSWKLRTDDSTGPDE